MTHPDILSAEIHGYPKWNMPPDPIGQCSRCGSDIFDGDEHVESYDEIFCDMECCHEYYGIKEISDV